MAKFLDDNGLLYLWTTLKNMFAKPSDIPDAVSDLTNDAGYVNAAGAAAAAPVQSVNGQTGAVQLSIPTETSDLTNDSNFVSDANYVHTDNNFTGALKTKLEGIAAGAQVNVIETIKVNGTIVTPTGKAVNITVPTVVSDLTNDAGYQTSAQVTAAIAAAVGEITGVSFEIVQSLPATGENGTIYLLSNGGSGTNAYDEYIYINNSWEKIGTTAVDLTGYWNSTNLTAITNAEIDTILAS